MAPWAVVNLGLNAHLDSPLLGQVRTFSINRHAEFDSLGAHHERLGMSVTETKGVFMAVRERARSDEKDHAA
jgi:hypothetical protein